MPLQQWVSSACTASYSNKVPDSASQTPDVIPRNESGNIDFSSVLTKRTMSVVFKKIDLSYVKLNLLTYEQVIFYTFYMVKILCQECRYS